MAKRAIAVARVSTDEQARDGKLSIPTQLDAIAAWCERAGYEVVDRVAEEGVSVTGVFDREDDPFWGAYQQLKAGEVETRLQRTHPAEPQRPAVGRHRAAHGGARVRGRHPVRPGAARRRPGLGLDAGLHPLVVVDRGRPPSQGGHPARAARAARAGRGRRGHRAAGLPPQPRDPQLRGRAARGRGRARGLPPLRPRAATRTPRSPTSSTRGAGRPLAAARG